MQPCENLSSNFDLHFQVSTEWLSQSSRTVDLGRESGFSNVDSKEAEDLVASHGELLTTQKVASCAHPRCSSFVGEETL